MASSFSLPPGFHFARTMSGFHFARTMSGEKEKEKQKDKEKERVVVITISSSSSSDGEEEEEVEVRSEEEKRRDDDECCILPSDPFAHDLIRNLSLCDRNNGDDDDLTVLLVRGQVACRDLPHQRDLCAKYPFSKTLHESYCPKCFCYVCEKIAPCESWKGPAGHCHASDQEKKWKDMRKAQQSAQPLEIKLCSEV